MPQLFGAQTNAKDSAGKDDKTAAEATVSENSVLTETNEAELPITTDTGNSNVSGTRSVTGIWVFIRMILVLAVILAIIWVIFKFMKKGIQPGEENDPFMRKVSSITLSPGKTVQIVTLLDHAYIIGVTDNAVNVIGTVEDKELVDAMNLYADKNANTKKPRNFADILDIFMPHGPRNNKTEAKKNNVFDGSAEQVVDMLKKQRDRLNKEEGQ